jgi:hypothetical protein
MVVERNRSRSAISQRKKQMLDAVLAVVEELRDFWPLSLRTIHYNLLNDPPLRNAGKPCSRYGNTKQCYKDLSDLCTRARFDGVLPFDAIHDPTRPVEHWRIHRNAADYLRSQFDDFLRGYWRDLLQSQPDHIEVIGEKNTLLPIITPVCSDYTAPLTIGRGFCSVPPRKAIYDRWRASEKKQTGADRAERSRPRWRDDRGFPCGLHAGRFPHPAKPHHGRACSAHGGSMSAIQYPGGR